MGRVAPTLQTKLLIDGQWRDSRSGKTFATINPATEEVIAEVAEGDAADIDLAVKAARKAFDSGPWRKMDARDRGRLMNRLADLIEENIDELAELETLDNGKPIGESRNGDLPLVIDCFRYYAGWADKIHGQTIPIRGNYFCYTQREPVGVAGQIIPWNFPMLMVAWKWGPALAAGCTVVMKPAEQTPLTALRMGELALEAGFPDGRHQHRPRLRRDRRRRPGEAPGRRQDRLHRRGPRPAKIIMRNAAETLKRITFELGGKSPNIVFADADLDAAVDGALLGHVPEPGPVLLRREPAVRPGRRSTTSSSSKLAAKVKARKLGDPFDPATQQGPQVDKAQFDKIMRYIDQGQGSRGPRCVTGGERHGDKGFFIKPTIFADVKDDMAIACDEIFGPVLSVIKFKDDRGGHRAGQHDRLRPGRRRLDPRHRQGPRDRRPRPRRHRLGQLLRRLRRRRPVRRLQEPAASAASSARRPSTTTPS